MMLAYTATTCQTHLSGVHSFTGQQQVDRWPFLVCCIH